MATKTLQVLIDKALVKGTAAKKNPYRAPGNRGYMNGTHGATVTAENQWKVEAVTVNVVTSRVTVEHYDTLIADIRNDGYGWKLHDWYAESASDRDALNQIAIRFDLLQRFYIRGGEVKEQLHAGV